jgi:hypothetical protein
MTERGVGPLVGEAVLVTPGPFDMAGAGEEHPGLAEEVEGQVGQGHILLQLRGVGNPFGQAVAVDEGVIAEHQTIGGQVGRIDPVGYRGGDLRLGAGGGGTEGPAGIVLTRGL